MVTFLTTEWIEALDAAARARPPHSAPLADSSFVVEQSVTGLPGGDDVTYHVTFEGDRMSVRPGVAADPTVRFTQDAATAAGIASGKESAQAAFMSGRLRVGGDLTVLVTNAAALAELADVFAEVRSRTAMPAGLKDA